MSRIQVISDLLAEKKYPLRGIEIGCLNGDFAAGILSKQKELHLTSIDVVPRYAEIYKKMIENNLAAEPKFKLINTTSDEAIKFLHRVYDFVFIDGDHGYEQTRRDILNYWQVIKPGGLIAGHNYEEGSTPAHPGVAKAVKEIFGNNFKTGADFTWWRNV